MFSRWSIGHRGWVALALLLLTLGLSATVVRIVKKYQTPGLTDGIHEGLVDFHNGVFFPSLALVNGDSPYGSRYAAEYPVSRQIPFFSPAIVALHVPLTCLPLRVAEVVYFVVMVLLVLAISAQSLLAAGLEKRLDWLLMIAAGIVFSRAGHVTLFNGYFTFELVLATIVAVRFADSRPFLAAIALVIVSAKPTFILPLGFLMLARGNIKPLVLGAVMSIVAAALPLAWLAHHEGDGDLGKGLVDIRQQIADAQEVHHNEPNELPALSWTRVDIFAIYAKWTNQDPGDTTHLIVMLGIVVFPMAVLHIRRRQGVDDGVAGLTGAIIMTAMIVSLYRQSYDVLLLAPPLVGIVGRNLAFWRSLGAGTRIVLAMMMIFPAYNYLSTQMVLGKADFLEGMIKTVTSLNAIVMVILLIWLCILACKDNRSLKIPR